MVALSLGALAWVVGLRIPGIALAQSIAERMICAVRLTEDCGNEPALRAAHGADLAAVLREHAPALLYEEGMTALPVDFRRCRSDACAAGPGSGAVSKSDQGERTVAFTHVIDCRPGRIAATEAWGGICSGPSAGNLYLQFWLYYPGSATAEGSTPLKGPIRTVSKAIGHPTHHPDDWEAYHVRIAPNGTDARASSHRGYSYELGGRRVFGYRLTRGPGGALRLERVPNAVNGWGPNIDTYYISGGSHAGNARVGKRVSRTTKDHRLTLIPLESLANRDSYRFAVTPPWRKRVYFDPEYSGTD